MNGKTAKYLARVARAICLDQDIDPGEGHNQYNQLENHVVWEAAYADGKPHLPVETKTVEEEVNGIVVKKKVTVDPNEGRVRMTDQDGHMLIKPVKKPGTVYTAWRFRMAYHNLKKLWMKTRGKHRIFNDYVV